jgi:hypothetical protein
VFKGSGFYATDHRSPSGANGKHLNTKSEEKSEEKPETKSETKSDTTENTKTSDSD